MKTTSTAASIILFATALLLGGCATTNSDTDQPLPDDNAPRPLTGKPPAAFAADPIRKSFGIPEQLTIRQVGRPGDSPGLTNEKDRDRVALTNAYKEAEAYVTAELNRLQDAAAKHSKDNTRIIGTGILAGVASTVLTAANPAANAGWIAGTTGVATGALTFRNDRALEGFSAQAVAEQYLRVQHEIAEARLEYGNARVAMESADDAKQWNINYQKAGNAINRLRSAGQLKGVPLGKASDNEAITSVMKEFLTAMKDERTRLTGGPAPSPQQQASDDLLAATVEEKKAADTLAAAVNTREEAEAALAELVSAAEAATKAKTEAEAALTAYTTKNPEPPAVPADKHQQWADAKAELEATLETATEDLVATEARRLAAVAEVEMQTEAETAAKTAAETASKTVTLTKALLDAAIALELAKTAAK